MTRKKNIFVVHLSFKLLGSAQRNGWIARLVVQIPRSRWGLKPVLNKSVFSPFEIFIVIFQLIVFHSLQ